MNLIKSAFQQKYGDLFADDDIRPEIFLVLRDLSNTILPAVLILGLLALAVVLVQTLTGEASFKYFFIYAFLYLSVFVVAVFRRRLPVPWVFFILLACIYGITLAALLNRGLAGTGMMHMVFLCIFAGIYLGARSGMTILVFSAATLIILGIAICSGFHATRPDQATYLMHPMNWVMQIACLFLYVVPLILSARGLHRKMAEAQRELKEQNRRLEAEIIVRRDVEGKLRESESKFRDLAEKSIAGIYLIQDGIIRYANQKFADTFGYRLEDVIDKLRLSDLVFREDLPAVQHKIDQRLTGELEFMHYEFRVVTRDGDVKDAEVFSSRTIYDGKPAVIGTLLDITERKRAEAVLRESESRLSQIIDLVPLFIYARDRSGRYLLANKALAQAYGATVEALIGKTDADFNLPGDNVKRFGETDLAVMDSGRMLEIPEESITDAKGRVYYLQTTKIPFQLRKTGERAVLGVSRDITARKKTEKALQESERKYRSIFEHAVEGIFQSTPDGRLLSANPALAHMLGYGAPEDMMAEISNIGKQVYTRKGERGQLAALLQSQGAVAGYETRMYRKDRSMIWVSVNCRALYDDAGRIVSLEGSLEDITKRKQAEMALVESEAKYRSVVESPLAGFFIIQEGRFRFVNHRCCEVIGYAYNEIVNVMNTVDVIHPDDRMRVEENVARCLAAKGEVIQLDARIVHQDGRIITARIFISAARYNDDEAISGTFIDITREKILESQLRQAQKMEAIGQLAGGIAHDFNNILTAFNGYGSILQIKMPKEDPRRIYVDQILSAAQKAASLTQNLLAFSRQQSITLAPIDLNQSILGSEKLLRRLLTEDITFTSRLSSTPITILADATQIDQILFNLVTNARDAMPQGGHLRLETDLVVLENDFWELHGFGKPGRYAYISISDTGSGMDKATREKIFDPFFTTKEPGRGTGLGLATVYGIVKQHNGYIIVQSEPMRGTTFRIYFPAIKATVEAEASVPVELKRGSETILVAEDNEEVRAFIKDVFDMTGYRMIEAVDGEDAVRKFQETLHIDMVILDSVMPKKNGRQVFDEITKIKPGVKVLFTSGYTRDVILDKGIRDKEFHFLAKPLSPGTLLKKVRELLDG